MKDLELMPTLDKSFCISDNNFLTKKNIISQFYEQVQKTPHRPAAIFKNKSLTYEELDQKSNQLARYLRDLGVSNNVIVGCYLPNGLNLIISLLAILKVGGTYLPLDPNYPSERLSHMIADSKVNIILTEENELSFEKQLLDLNKVIKLDCEYSKIDSYSENSITLVSNLNDIAYIVYTSGSTGKPKGIAIEHKALSSIPNSHSSYFQKDLKGLLTGSISFDASILIIFQLLTSGGSVFLPSSKAIPDPSEIIEFIRNHQINYILCVPSFYLLLLDKENELYSLKIVSLAGETMPNSVIQRHAKIAPNAFLYNLYGPTEYAIGASIAKIYNPEEKAFQPISIGQNLRNSQIYILDNKQIKSSINGEICISGPGLARGYLNKPDLTAEKFVTYNSERIYRTGDIGRFLPNGNLEIIGRLDNQVKIRGFRIELAEIEHVVLQCPAVDECVVVVKEKQDQTKYLVAYYTSINKKEAETKLKSFICKRLPNHMVPTKFVYLENFERTPVGKIDRKKLPEPFLKLDSSKHKKPETKLQEILYLIWKTILCLDSLCIHDNFFDLGGNSFTLARLQTQIEKELNIKLSVTELLQYTTIFQLGEYLSKKTQPKNIRLYKERAAKRKFALNKLRKRAVNE